MDGTGERREQVKPTLIIQPIFQFMKTVSAAGNLVSNSESRATCRSSGDDMDGWDRTGN